MHIAHIKTSPYRPQTNGCIERFHQTLMQMVRKCEDTQKDWDEALPLFLFACRYSSLPAVIPLCLPWCTIRDNWILTIWVALWSTGSWTPGHTERAVVAFQQISNICYNLVTRTTTATEGPPTNSNHKSDEIQGGLEEQVWQKSIRQVIPDRRPSLCLCSSGDWKENWEVSGSLAGAIHGDWKDLSSNLYDWDAGQVKDLKNSSRWGDETLDYPQPTHTLPQH